MKKALRMITVFAILLTMLAVWDVFGMQAQAATWSGSGTATSPYIISDESGLRLLATNVKNGSTYSGKYFKVSQNITLTQTWTPIGTSSVSFKGSFDGNGYTISGMTVTGNYSGLFAYLGSGATVKNVTLTGVSLTGDKYLGGIAAYADAGSGAINITNCKVSGTLRDSNDGNTDGYIGGILGYAKADSGSMTISGCVSSGTLECSDYSGGIVGRGVGKDQSLKLENCTNNAYIDVFNDGNNCGGLAGYISSAHFIGCVNYGNVAGNGYSEDNGTSWLGGFAGSGSSVTYTGCGNYGNVATFFGGGIDPTQYSGPYIDSCLNVGKISGSSDGYQTGLSYSGTAYNSYSSVYTKRGTQVSTAELQSGAIAFKLRDYFGQTLGVDEYPKPLTTTNRVYMVMVVGEHTGVYYVNYGKTVSLPQVSDCVAFYEGETKFDTSTPITRDYVLAAKGYHSYTDGVCKWCGNTGVDYVDVGVCGNSVAWKLSNDGVLTISGTGAMNDLSAGAPWYSLRSQIKSVKIEEGVTYLGAHAFKDLTGVTSVTMADSVTEIGPRAFSGCTGLTALTLSNRLTTIGSYAFSNCTGLTSVTIPANMTIIANSAFRGCAGLTRVTLGSGLGIIGAYTFAETGLTSVEVPASVTTVGEGAFANNADLEYIIFRGTAPDISTSAFTGSVIECRLPDYDSTWTTVVNKSYSGTVTWVLGSGSCGDNAKWVLSLDKTLTISGTGSMYDYSLYYGKLTTPWSGLEDRIEKVVVCDGITKIGDYAFYNCANLTSVTIADSVTEIGYLSTSAYYATTYGYVFGNCTALTQINIPKNVSKIAYTSFSGCTKLTAINVDTGNSAYYSRNGVLYNNAETVLYAYPGGKSGSFTVPSSVKTISYAAFSQCTGLTSIDLGQVKTVQKEAFEGCTGLTALTIPSTVTTIESYAFNCTNVTRITFKGSAPTIDSSAFWYVKADVDYPLSDTTWTAAKLKNYGGTLSWKSVSGTCGSGLTWQLVYINAQATLKISGTGAMDDYTDGTQPWSDHLTTIKAVEIGSGVTNIGAYAFYECTALTSLTMSDTVTAIGNSACGSCSALNSVTWSAGLKTIGESTFVGTKLSGITFPNSLTTVGRYAFYNCTSLKSITFGNKLQSIGYTAFAYCTSLNSVDLGTSVTTLEQSAFNNCTALTKMVIPASVTTVGKYVFSNCSALQYVEFLGNAPTFDSASFTNATFRAYYLSSKTGWTTSKLANYGGTVSWGALSKRGTCGSSAEWILDEAGNLFICGSGSMSYYSSVADIPWYAHTASIKKVIVGGKVQSLNYYAFSGCSNLTEAQIGSSVTSISKDAFASCGSLQVVIFSGSAPSFNAAAFTDTTCEIWYTSSWSSSVLKDYGGKLTWRKTTSTGTCGDDAKWALDSAGTLVILGTGAMNNYTSTTQPWYSVNTTIKAVVIGDKITSIGNYAFRSCSAIQTATVGSGVTSVGNYAFGYCSAMETVNFLGDPPTFNSYTFYSTTTTANYPIANTKWTSGVMKHYGGTVTWVALCTQHKEVISSAVAATCTTTGLTEGKSCSLCKEVLVAQEVIPAKGHMVLGPDNTVVPADSVADSCTQTRMCTVCNGVAKPAMGHRIIGRVLGPVDPVTITNDKSYPFVLKNGAYYSQNKSNRSSAGLTVTADYACSLTLQLGVSSEEDFDELSVSHNGVTKTTISGETSATLNLTLAAGDIVYIQYSKDSSDKAGSDCGWVTLVFDQVTGWTDGDVPAETGEPDCTNGVVCRYCQMVVKEPLGHRVIFTQTETDLPYEITNTSATPFELVDGTYYSQNHTGSSSADLQIVALRACQLELRYGVSSEPTYDKLMILLNGTQKTAVSGEQTGLTMTFTLAAGDKLIVRYQKDGGVNRGEDQGWVTLVYTPKVTQQIVPADSLEASCTEGVTCSYCQAEAKPPVGHSWDQGVEKTPATEEVEGEMLHTCMSCGETKTEKIPVLEHVHNYSVAVTLPTCVDAGYTTYTCRCGDSYKADEVAALGHTEVTDPAVAPSCTQTGLTEGKHCSVCGAVTVAQETVDMVDHSYEKGSCSACGHVYPLVYVIRGDVVTTYGDLGVALENMESGAWLQLLEDVQADVTLTKDLYVDLNGKQLSGTMTTNGFEVYGMDSSTDGYTCDSMGSFACTDDQGNSIVPVRHFKTNITGQIRRYMCIDQEGVYSFHRFYVGITKVTLRPGDTGFGYKARFMGDEQVLAALDSYGFELTLDGCFAVNNERSAANLDVDREYSLLLRNFDVARYGETQVRARVYLALTDGTVIFSEEVSYSMMDMLGRVCKNLSAYSDAQIQAVQTMCQPYEIYMTGWGIEALLDWKKQ